MRKPPTPILATKLYIPSPQPAIVPRSRLIEQLDEGLHRKLTLISAAAGFGKTALISEWVDSLDKDDTLQNQVSNQITWFSLDENDNDLVRFLTYFVAALNQIEGMELSLEETLGFFQSHQTRAAEAIFTSLINEIATLPGKIIFILDDYHLIENQPIHAALNFFLENLPAQLHLVIATREDPPLLLSRWRARGQLTELRVADLRFTLNEVAEFLTLVMGFKLSAEEIEALEMRTEGWIAGLQLAALSMRGREDVSGFIRTFTGDNRYIGEYLVEEVLSRQPERMRLFLLQTSILNRLNGSLCEAVTSQDDSSALLEAFVRDNLFVIPLDDKHHWFRYHHLFADVLNAHLLKEQPKQVPILHDRASEWHEKFGEAVEAYQHAFAGENFDRAAELAEKFWRGMDENLQSSAWLAWTGQLPEEVIQVRPVLCTQLAWSLTDTGQPDASESRLQDAERCLAGSLDDMIVVDKTQFQALPARIAFARAYNSQITGPPSATVKYAEKALTLVSDDDPFLRAQIEVVLGSAYWSVGSLNAAAQAMRKWIVSAENAGNFVFAVASGFGLADILIAQGHLREAVSTIHQSLQLASKHEEARGVIANHYLGLTWLAIEMGDVAAIEHHNQHSTDLLSQSTLIDTPYRNYLVQARLKAIDGDLDAALDRLNEAQRVYVNTPIPNTRPVEALKACIFIKQGQLAKAWNWVREHGLSVDDEIHYLNEFEHLTLARVLIAEYRSKPEEHFISDAFELLGRLITAAEEVNRTGSIIEILIVQALAYEAQAEITSALEPLKQALKLAATEGYLRIFVDEGPPMVRLLYEALSHGIEEDYVRRLLKETPDAKPEKTNVQSRQSDLIEPLSEREIEVLQLIAEGLTNQEIANQLYLSLHTVKIHARNIYAKLGVKNRTQAVNKGKTVGILMN